MKSNALSQEKIWDLIAKPWQACREKPLPEVVEFLKEKRGRILDCCCGSGRHFSSIHGQIYGTDFSEIMLQLAKQQADHNKTEVTLKKSEATSLPFESNFFDAAIYIASLHCIETPEKRNESIRELFRVLKPGAEALISVWSRGHKRVKNKPKEALIPWTVEGKTFDRYYYLYDKKEIEQDLQAAGFEVLTSNETENIILKIKKSSIS